jgi:hypothetical protein
MTTVHENVKKLAPDLTKTYPRSPRAMVGGYILAARALDKCRADLAGTLGEYHYDCPLDNMFLGFAGIKGADLREFIATGADDEAVRKWIEEHATQRPKIEIIKWNNEYRYKRISELPDKLQEFMEGYIPEVIPKELLPQIDYFFDVFDAEEKRIKA